GAPDFFRQYVGFLQAMGGHAVFIPNIFKGTVEELGIYLKTMAEARVPIEAVVLGMEVRLGPFSFKDSAAYIRAIEPYVAFRNRCSRCTCPRRLDASALTVGAGSRSET